MEKKQTQTQEVAKRIKEATLRVMKEAGIPQTALKSEEEVLKKMRRSSKMTPELEKSILEDMGL